MAMKLLVIIFVAASFGEASEQQPCSGEPCLLGGSTFLLQRSVDAAKVYRKTGAAGIPGLESLKGLASGIVGDLQSGGIVKVMSTLASQLNVSLGSVQEMTAAFQVEMQSGKGDLRQGMAAILAEEFQVNQTGLFAQKAEFVQKVRDAITRVVELWSRVCTAGKGLETTFDTALSTTGQDQLKRQIDPTLQAANDECSRMATKLAQVQAMLSSRTALAQRPHLEQAVLPPQPPQQSQSSQQATEEKDEEEDAAAGEEDAENGKAGEEDVQHTAQTYEDSGEDLADDEGDSVQTIPAPGFGETMQEVDQDEVDREEDFVKTIAAPGFDKAGGTSDQASVIDEEKDEEEEEDSLETLPAPGFGRAVDEDDQNTAQDEQGNNEENSVKTFRASPSGEEQGDDLIPLSGEEHGDDSASDEVDEEEGSDRTPHFSEEHGDERALHSNREDDDDMGTEEGEDGSSMRIVHTAGASEVDEEDLEEGVEGEDEQDVQGKREQIAPAAGSHHRTQGRLVDSNGAESGQDFSGKVQQQGSLEAEGEGDDAHAPEEEDEQNLLSSLQTFDGMAPEQVCKELNATLQDALKQAQSFATSFESLFGGLTTSIEGAFKDKLNAESMAEVHQSFVEVSKTAKSITDKTLGGTSSFVTGLQAGVGDAGFAAGVKSVARTSQVGNFGLLLAVVVAAFFA